MADWHSNKSELLVCVGVCFCAQWASIVYVWWGKLPENDISLYLWLLLVLLIWNRTPLCLSSSLNRVEKDGGARGKWMYQRERDRANKSKGSVKLHGKTDDSYFRALISFSIRPLYSSSLTHLNWLPSIPKYVYIRCYGTYKMLLCECQCECECVSSNGARMRARCAHVVSVFSPASISMCWIISFWRAHRQHGC